MARKLTLASGTLPEFRPAEVIRAAGEAGFDGCGVWFDAASWSDASGRAVRRAFEETGLEPLEIEVVMIRPGAHDAAHDRLLDAGAEIGARCAIVVSLEPDAASTRRRFARLCERAGALGIAVCLEFLPVMAVRTLAEAVSVVDDVGHPAGRLLVDALHLARSGGHPDDLAAVAPERLAFAQICDARARPPGSGSRRVLLDEALNGRLPPGHGALPLAELVGALPFDAPLSLELRSKALRETHPDAVERARHAYDETVRGLERLGAR